MLPQSVSKVHSNLNPFIMGSDDHGDVVITSCKLMAAPRHKLKLEYYILIPRPKHGVAERWLRASAHLDTHSPKQGSKGSPSPASTMESGSGFCSSEGQPTGRPSDRSPPPLCAPLLTGDAAAPEAGLVSPPAVDPPTPTRCPRGLETSLAGRGARAVLGFGGVAPGGRASAPRSLSRL